MRTLLTLSATFAVLLTTLSAQTAHAQSVVTREGAYSISTYDTKFGIGVSVYRGRETQPIDKISYTGDCKKYPTLYAYLWPEHKALKAFESSGDYNDLNMGRPTEIFTRELAKRCPNVTDIKIKLGRGDRLVVASFAKGTGWQNIQAKLTAEEAASPETKAYEKLVTNGSANTVLTLMKKRNYDAIRLRHSGYYREFHNQFLSMYSSMCAPHIDNPESIEVKSITEVFDSNGFNVDSYETGKSYTIFVDRKYSGTYLRYRKAGTLQGLGKILKAEIENRRKNPNAWGNSGVIAVTKEAGANGERIRRFIDQGCKHSEVLSIYNRLSEVLP